MASAMTAGEVSIDPDFGFVIHSSKMQQDTFGAPILWNLERTPVPYDIMKRGIVNAAQLTLEAVRHQDFLRELSTTRMPALCLPLVAVIKLELPGTIQGLPFRPHEIGSGVFRTRNISSQERGYQQPGEQALSSDSEEKCNHR